MATAHQSQHLKKAFLEAFARTGNVSRSARIAGCLRNTVYRWQEIDDQFAAAYREAEIVATEVLEGMAHDRASGYGAVEETSEVLRDDDGRPVYDAQGVPQFVTTRRVAKQEYSATLLIFLLKARAPEKYRERYDLTRSDAPLVKAYAAEDVELLR